MKMTNKDAPMSAVMADLRREVNEGLNVVESWNAANGFIFYGEVGAIHEPPGGPGDGAALSSSASA